MKGRNVVRSCCRRAVGQHSQGQPDEVTEKEVPALTANVEYLAICEEEKCQSLPLTRVGMLAERCHSQSSEWEAGQKSGAVELFAVQDTMILMSDDGALSFFKECRCREALRWWQRARSMPRCANDLFKEHRQGLLTWSRASTVVQQLAVPESTKCCSCDDAGQCLGRCRVRNRLAVQLRSASSSTVVSPLCGTTADLQSSLNVVVRDEPLYHTVHADEWRRLAISV